MILRRLRVQHFRCFRNPVELSGLSTGIHVIHAPNETGKSSLVLAVARALFDRYSTKDREIQQLRPWQTTLSPRITLEFETAGKRYRLEKSFLDDASCMLEEWTGTRFERLADSQQADELVRGFLTSSVPGSGATKVGHWGLARLLWLNQSAERQEVPQLDTPLKARLLETVGVAALSDEEQALLKAIEVAYGQFYTPKKGKLVAGGDLLQVEEHVRALDDEVKRLNQRKVETARLADGITDNHYALASLLEEQKDYELKLADLHERIEQEAQLERQAVLREKDVESQRLQQRNLDQKQRDILVRQQKVTQYEALAAQKESAIQAAQEVCGRAEEGLRDATDRFKAQQGELEKAELRLDRGRLLEGTRELLEEQRRLEGLVKQGTRLANAGETSRRKTAALKVLSDSDVKRTEDVQRKMEQARARLEVQGIEVVFKAESTQNIEWEAEGHTIRHKVSKDDQKVFTGVSAAGLRIKGVGLLSVRTGAEEVGKLQAELEKYRKELARRLREQGVGDLAGLRKAWEAQQLLLQEQQKHEDALSTFLETADVESVEALQQKLREVQGDTGGRVAQLGIPEEGLAAYPFADVISLAEEVKVCKREVKAREKAREEAETAYRKAERQLQALIQERKGALGTAHTLRLEVQSQLGAMGLTLEQLGAEVEKAGTELARLENMLQGLRAQLPRPEERAATRRQQLQEAHARVADSVKRTREEIIRAETLIGQAAAEGLYSQLCDVEEKLALMKERAHQLQTRARATERLRNLALAWQEQVSRTFVGPIEKEIHSRLEHIRGGGRPEHLVLNSEFSEAQMQTSAGLRPLDSFSWGTQEQTLFALRLALGSLLSTRGPRPEPQLVVLDDALVNTDAARHRRALELIESAGDALQVLILTAFPERYRTLRGLKEFDLKALSCESA
ncbi:AAA family ATPase [Stigmatella erecta]|uniref:DNA repair exonuclease SbcCD ATPase subunit n=1 Tax=Stigmatella erecta TaxID=83460 RepID=A0A1I0D1B8_9BACT|nr:AAA family ATPase [Stigmatella erecta]SET25532.1 DNA repair exonuclease SbcCD ATPase subunit [Stigmatella erecta]